MAIYCYLQHSVHPKLNNNVLYNKRYQKYYMSRGCSIKLQTVARYSSSVESLRNQLSGVKEHKDLLTTTIHKMAKNDYVVNALKDELESADPNLNDYTSMGVYKMLLAVYHANNTSTRNLADFFRLFSLSYEERFFWLERESMAILDQKYRETLKLLIYDGSERSNRLIEQGLLTVKGLYMQIRLCFLSDELETQSTDDWSESTYAIEKFVNLSMKIREDIERKNNVKKMIDKSFEDNEGTIKKNEEDYARWKRMQDDADKILSDENDEVDKRLKQMIREIEEWRSDNQFKIKTDNKDASGNNQSCDLAIAREINNILDEVITAAKREAREQSPGNEDYANGLCLVYIMSMVDNGMIGKEIRQSAVASKHMDVSKSTLSMTPVIVEAIVSAVTAVASHGFSVILSAIKSVLTKSIEGQVNMLFFNTNVSYIDSLFRKECGCYEGRPAVMLMTMLTYDGSRRRGLTGFYRMSYNKGIAWDYREFYASDDTTVARLRYVKNKIISGAYRVSPEKVGALSQIVRDAASISRY